jgi:hypothetical protein
LTRRAEVSEGGSCWRILFSRKINARDFFEFVSENPIKILHVVGINGNELDAEVVVTRHFVFHRPLIFVPVVIVVHVQHSPILDINVVVRQKEIWAADFLGENPDASPNFFFVLKAKPDGIEVFGNALFGTAADFDA